MPLLVLLRYALVKLSTSLMTASDSLDEAPGPHSSTEGPLDLEHAPVLLQSDNCPGLLVAFLLSLTAKGKRGDRIVRKQVIGGLT